MERPFEQNEKDALVKDVVQRYNNSYRNLNRAIFRRKFETAFRIYIQENKYVNIFNYWWYRYISNDFKNWMIKKFID